MHINGSCSLIEISNSNPESANTVHRPNSSPNPSFFTYKQICIGKQPHCFHLYIDYGCFWATMAGWVVETDARHHQLTKSKIFTLAPYTKNVWQSLLTPMQEYVKHQNGPNLGGKKHGNSKLEHWYILIKVMIKNVKMPLIWVYEAVRLWKLCCDDFEIILCLATPTRHK